MWTKASGEYIFTLKARWYHRTLTIDESMVVMKSLCNPRTSMALTRALRHAACVLWRRCGRAGWTKLLEPSWHFLNIHNINNERGHQSTRLRRVSSHRPALPLCLPLSSTAHRKDGDTDLCKSVTHESLPSLTAPITTISPFRPLSSVTLAPHPLHHVLSAPS